MKNELHTTTSAQQVFWAKRLSEQTELHTVKKSICNQHVHTSAKPKNTALTAKVGELINPPQSSTTSSATLLCSVFQAAPQNQRWSRALLQCAALQRFRTASSELTLEGKCLHKVRCVWFGAPEMITDGSWTKMAETNNAYRQKGRKEIKENNKNTVCVFVGFTAHPHGSEPSGSTDPPHSAQHCSWASTAPPQLPYCKTQLSQFAYVCTAFPLPLQNRSNHLNGGFPKTLIHTFFNAERISVPKGAQHAVTDRFAFLAPVPLPQPLAPDALNAERRSRTRSRLREPRWAHAAWRAARLGAPRFAAERCGASALRCGRSQFNGRTPGPPWGRSRCEAPRSASPSGRAQRRRSPKVTAVPFTAPAACTRRPRRNVPDRRPPPLLPARRPAPPGPGFAVSAPSPPPGAACAASPPHGPARRLASPPRTAASRPPRSGRRIWDPRRAPRCPAAAAPAPRTPGLRLRLLPPGPAPVSLRRPPPTSGAREIASGPKAEPERPNPVQGGKETCAPPGMERTAHGGRQRPPADWRSLRRSRAPSVVLALCFTEISPNSDPSPSALRQGNEPGLPRLGERTETRRGLRPPQDFIQMALIQKWHKSTTVHPVSPHPRGKGSPEPTGTSVSYSVHHMVDSHWR